MSTRDHGKNQSQQARIRLRVISLALLFVLTLLVVPVFIPGFARQVGPAEAAGKNSSSIWLDGPDQAIQGETISYDITTDAAGLFGVQLELSFDPAVLQVVNAQLTPGVCPQPDFVQANSANNTTGVIEYVVTQLNPTPPCNGGVVASFQFEVSPTAADGPTAVEFDEVIMGDNDGTEIPVTAVDLNLQIGPKAVEADFSALPNTGRSPLTVNFTDLSSGDHDTCTWDFGDSSGSSTCGNQSHIYADPGTYTVSLSISGPGGSDSETKVDYIIVRRQLDLYIPVIFLDYP
jgi:hypothetical protein